ncbi:MAG TPA: VOC family protein [Fimbriimonadaceae bacterium]|nr:VOC family protein [Fimbriimonadaceae bacterium]
MPGYSRGLHEIVLVVKDVRRAAAFYCNLLGLEEISPATDDWAQLWTKSSDDEQWIGFTSGQLLFEEHSPRSAGTRFGPVHFAFRGERAQKDEFLARAKDLGVVLLGPQQWKSRMKGTSYYFYDPDDNLAELWFPDETDSG